METKKKAKLKVNTRSTSVEKFMNALFDLEDIVELRCIEAWEENGKNKTKLVERLWLGKNERVFHRENSSILGITPQIWRSPPGQISTIFLPEDSVYLSTVFQEVLSSTDNRERGSLFCQKRGPFHRFLSCIGNKQFSFSISSISFSPFLLHLPIDQ